MGFYADRIFPTLLEWAVRSFEEDRPGVVGEARGRVLEIGVGSGANLPRYGPGVAEVVGIDPHAALLHRALERAAALQSGPLPAPPFRFSLARAESLPFPDASFDAVVAFLVFCTVDEPERAAGEVFRVLRPGGTLLFFEHVRARHRGLAWLQDRANPVWRRVAVGCNLNRDTRSVFEGAGFVFRRFEELDQPRALRPALPRIRGVAVRPGGS